MEKQLDGPRSCRPEERSELLALINLVFRVSGGRQPSVERDYPHIYRQENLSNVRVIRIDGGLRASAGTLPMRIATDNEPLDTVGVNCTTTHPDWRNRGLGALLMRDIEDQARIKERDLVHLAAGVPEWYRRFGFEDGGCIYTYRLNRGNVDLLPFLGDLEVRTGLERYVDEIHRIHSAEGVGTCRTKEDVPIILGRDASEIFAGIQGGQVKAYAVVNLRHRLVKEHGGPPELVAALFRTVYDYVDSVNDGRSTTARNAEDRVELVSDLRVEVTPQQTAVIQLFNRIGVPVNVEPWHMLQIIDPVAILRKIGVKGVELVSRGKEFVLQSSAERDIVLNRRMLVKALFGPEKISVNAMVDGLPFLLSTPSTDHV